MEILRGREEIPVYKPNRNSYQNKRTPIFEEVPTLCVEVVNSIVNTQSVC